MGKAVHVMRIATGEVKETSPPHDGKDKAAQALGRKGGRARADTLTESERKAIVSKAARARRKKDHPVQARKART